METPAPMRATGTIESTERRAAFDAGEASMDVHIGRTSAEFGDWDTLMRLLHAAFAGQNGRIDPPSSLHRLDIQSIALKARDEVLFIATENAALIGCIFAKPRADALYVGKLAVWPECQGKGIGRALMQAAEDLARATGLSVLELDTRIELTENHATFAALGFVKTAEKAHDGYTRPTFITMRKRLD